MHEAYTVAGDSYVFIFHVKTAIFSLDERLLFSANALQMSLELLGTYTKETALKARSDAEKYVLKIGPVIRMFIEIL